MDGDSFNALKTFDSCEISESVLLPTDPDDSLGAVRGLMMVLAFEAAVIGVGWGAWRLVSSVFS
jgi:hypothetical protein